MKVAVLGAGRMGRALVRCIEARPELELAGVWARNGDLHGLLEAADVAVDFTLPDATLDVLAGATRAGKPLVCGVTGLDDRQMKQVAEAAGSIALLYDRNMSVGIAVLAELVALAGASLGPAFAATIHEVHHVHKKDAPSGTALKLAESLARARGREFRDVYRFRPGGEAPRESAGDIVVTAERCGEVAGEHRVRFESGLEALDLHHSVSDRSVFAEGALTAAAWLTGRPAGLYAMRDVVQARSGGDGGGGDRTGDSVN